MSTSKQTAKRSDKLDELDRRLERLKQSILPDTPYLMDLTAPSRYHVSPHQANNWRRSCRFDNHEEQLQYMTFLPHTLRGDTMLRTSGDWDNGEGKMKLDPARPISGGSSGAISPSGQQPKKKISLLEYKNKMSGQPSERNSPKAVKAELPSSTGQPSDSEMIMKPETNGVAPLPTVEDKVNPSQQAKGKAPQGQKRSADAMTEGQDAKIFDIQPPSPPLKKQQTETSRQRNDTPSINTNGNVHGLPRMLSPTLPAIVEERLAQLRKGNAQPAKKPDAVSSTDNKTKATPERNIASDRSKPRTEGKAKEAGTETVEKGKLPKYTALQAQNTSVKASEHRNGLLEKTGTPTKSMASTSEAHKASKTGPRPDSRTFASNASNGKLSQGEQKRHIVRLKIPKRLRKDCQRIVQMQPRPRKSPSQAQTTPLRDRSKERPTSNGNSAWQSQQEKAVNGSSERSRSESTSSKPKAVARSPGTPKAGEKRRQPDDDRAASQVSGKRQRLSGAAELQRPSTPTASFLISPNVQQPNSSHKSQLSTPKNSLKSAAMQRISSTEGDVQTPLGSIRSNTPTAPGSAERLSNQHGRSSSNVSSASTSMPNGIKNDEGAAFYKAEFNHYCDLAKTLKRRADALAKLPNGQINSNTVALKEGLALAVETILCYMLAFTLKDEHDRIKRLPSDRAAWASLLPYFNFPKSLLGSFAINNNTSPHDSTNESSTAILHGFLYQLEHVCRATINHHDLDRLKREATATDDDAVTFRKQMVENYELATQCGTEGADRVSMEAFRTDFPETWEAQAPTRSRGREKLIPKNYGQGGYRLPLTGATSTVEAVRAGWAFLTEWCLKEDVTWEGKTFSTGTA